MDLKHAIQKCSHLHTALVAARDAGNRMLSYPCFLLERMRPRRDGPIRVVFLIQEPSVWNKALPTYRRMLADPDFEPMILCLPSSLEGCFECENETYRYFIQAGYSHVLNAVQGKGWLDPKTLHADYFVILRPYDNYRPRPYKSINLCKYGKIVLIFYATQLVPDMIPQLLNSGFLPSVSLYFAESEYAREVFLQKNKLKCLLGLQKSIYCGVPALESMLLMKDQLAPSWEFSRNSFRVVWTPRWSINPVDGGSNFLRYREQLSIFFTAHSNMDLLIRPHPLMFQNFIDCAVMTQDEIDAFSRFCSEAKNISLDVEKDYGATFWNSSVLICDTSSVMLDYFFTGRPLIFCRSVGIEWHFLPVYEKMLSACYSADSFEDISRILDALQHGIDPLKESRQKLVRELFPMTPLPSEIIVNALKENKE